MESTKEPPKKKGKHRDLIISIDEENNKCADCNKENPNKVSVNNGIVICEECANKHIQLGTKISFIRDLDDDYDEYLLNFFTLGSNSKFKQYLKDEKIDESLPIEKKYLTRACDLYRKNLKNKVQGEKQIEKNFENSNEILENAENYFPEFENYQVKKEVKLGRTKTQQAKDMLGHIGTNLFGFGKKMYSGMKYGANYVATKAQPAATQLKKGATFVGHQMGGAYTNIKHKITAKKSDQKGSSNEQSGQNDGKEENKNVPNNDGSNNNAQSNTPITPDNSTPESTPEQKSTSTPEEEKKE